jgi:hypothetical protein
VVSITNKRRDLLWTLSAPLDLSNLCKKQLPPFPPETA